MFSVHAGSCGGQWFVLFGEPTIIGEIGRLEIGDSFIMTMFGILFQFLLVIKSNLFLWKLSADNIHIKAVETQNKIIVKEKIMKKRLRVVWGHKIATYEIKNGNGEYRRETEKMKEIEIIWRWIVVMKWNIWLIGIWIVWVWCCWYCWIWLCLGILLLVPLFLICGNPDCLYLICFWLLCSMHKFDNVDSCCMCMIVNSFFT